jgi:TATA-box binding protein (TBP) (component of TFIID and TFIIIB)
MKVEATFKEFHVKVFNTGKLEIPGVQSEVTFKLILQQVIDTIQPHMETKLGYKENSDETVLINSNFNCGYFINREVLYDILKYKYNIQSIYDPCSYPGIQCKFYYNPDIGLQNGCQISEENKHLYDNVKEVSFMIFRTGSVLIVGRCDENVLFIIYDFLKNILNNEFKNICQKNVKVNQDGDVVLKDKKKKVRRKNITIEMNCEL